MVQGINNSGLTSGLLRTLNQAQNNEQSALEKISSGKQLNRAADNAAGLAIIERFAAQIDGFGQAIRNASDGVSFAQVAEAGLSSVSNDLQRIRELSVQAASGALSDSDRANLQSEVGQLQQQIRSQFEQSKFNGVSIFDRNAQISFQVGANAGDTVELATTDLSSQIDAITSLNISTQSAAQDALSVVDNSLQTLSDKQVEFGAVSNRLESAITNLQSNRVNTTDARSRIEDADLAKEVSSQIQGRIQQESSIAVQGQANSNARLVLQLLS